MSANTVHMTIFATKPVKESEIAEIETNIREILKRELKEDAGGYSLALEDKDFEFDFSGWWKDDKDYDWSDYEFTIEIDFLCKNLDFTAMAQQIRDLFDFVGEIHAETQFYFDDSYKWNFVSYNERLEEKDIYTDDYYEIEINDDTFHKRKYILAGYTEEEYENSLDKDEDEEGYIDEDEMLARLEEKIPDWMFSLNDAFVERVNELFQKHIINNDDAYLRIYFE